MSILKPHIYVACRTAYNFGTLHGKWINANQDVPSLKRAIQKMIAKSPKGPVLNTGEWIIDDYKDFCSIRLSKHASLENVSKIAAFIVEHGEAGSALLNNVGCLEEAEHTMEEFYQGVFKNEKEFAKEYISGIEPVPDYLDGYINYKKMARDMFSSDFFALDVKGKMYVFRK